MRALLAGMFLAGLALGILLIGFTYWNRLIYDDTAQKLMMSLWTVYSVPIGVIIGWAIGGRTTQQQAIPITWPVFIIELLALLWNSIVVWRIYAFATTDGETSGNLISFLDIELPKTYILVGLGLSFFFAKKE